MRLIKRFEPILLLSITLYTLLAIVLVGATLEACGSNARKESIHATFVTTNAARDAFITWDKQHQHEIVSNATSHDDGVAKLHAYYEKQAEIANLFVKMYQSIAAAQLANDDVSITAMVNLALQVKMTVDAITKGVP